MKFKYYLIKQLMDEGFSVGTKEGAYELAQGMGLWGPVPERVKVLASNLVMVW